MRTTLTLDDDVAAAITRLRRERGIPLRDLVNELLREGLRNDDRPRRARRFQGPTADLGKCLLGDLINVNEALDRLEGTFHR